MQLWFPAAYTESPSPFEGLCSLDYFTFLLTQLPGVALSSASYPAFLASGATVWINHAMWCSGDVPATKCGIHVQHVPVHAQQTISSFALHPVAMHISGLPCNNNGNGGDYAQAVNITVALPGKDAVDGAAYVATARAAASSSSSGATAGTTSASFLGGTDAAAGANKGGAAAGGSTAPAVTVVNIQASELEVQVAAPVVAGLGGPPPPPAPAPVDLSKLVDTMPPSLKLDGEALVSVRQGDRYSDAGATAYDNIDGISVRIITRYALCLRPEGGLDAAAPPAPEDTRQLACGPSLSSINSSAPLNENETYVVTYSARDAAGNAAPPVRRYVLVTARCAL